MPDIWMDVDVALSEVPVNIMPLLDDTDFKSRETSVAYNAAGMDLVWNFVTTGGAMTQTAVTPTTGGNYDWSSQGDGMYSIEIPASGGASINNDTEGFGWFSGIATGVLPWRGPIIGFRAAALNDALIDGGDTLDVNVTTVADEAAAAFDPSTDDVNVSSTSQDAIAAALLDLANGVESGKTVRQTLRLIAAVLCGKRSNAGTNTEQYDAIGAPGIARVVGGLTSGNGTPTLTP